MSFFGQHANLAGSYLSSFPAGPAEGDNPENINYARGGALAGFGDALMICGTKAVRQFTEGQRKFFQTRDEAEKFIAGTVGRWANAASDEYVRPNTEQIRIAHQFLSAAADEMFQ